MDLFTDWLTVERFLEWKKGITELKESKGEITDKKLIEKYQDYYYSFKALYKEIQDKLDECDIGYYTEY